MAGGQPGKRGGAIFHGERINGKISKEYRAWTQMRRRCKKHPHYVSRGISVCEQWKQFSAFLVDVGRAPSPKHTLDRYPNPAGNYEPGNVRWATMLEQSHNRAPGAKVGRPWLGKKRPDISGDKNYSAKLTLHQVQTIRIQRRNGVRVSALASQFGVRRQTITNICQGRTWNNVR